MRPEVAAATLKLLRASGAEVRYPDTQTCCGQIAFSSGYDDETASLMRKCAAEFADCETVVMPSGSCCAALHAAAAELFDEADAAHTFAGKCMELSQYLQQCDYSPPRHPAALTVTYHDSCSGLRELGIKQTPRRLLQQAGITIQEMADCEECCGFGGRFSVQFGALSTDLADRKCQHIIQSGAQAVVAGDVGCLLHIEGRLRRLGSELPVLHWATLLAAGL